MVQSRYFFGSLLKWTALHNKRSFSHCMLHSVTVFLNDHTMNIAHGKKKQLCGGTAFAAAGWNLLQAFNYLVQEQSRSLTWNLSDTLDLTWPVGLFSIGWNSVVQNLPQLSSWTFQFILFSRPPVGCGVLINADNLKLWRWDALPWQTSFLC